MASLKYLADLPVFDGGRRMQKASLDCAVLCVPTFAMLACIPAQARRTLCAFKIEMPWCVTLPTPLIRKYLQV